jgi:hypothetical protein
LLTPESVSYIHVQRQTWVNKVEGMLYIV